MCFSPESRLYRCGVHLALGIVGSHHGGAKARSPQDLEEVRIALALEKPADLRSAFLDAKCTGD
jgi:hypothetical protein